MADGTKIRRPRPQRPKVRVTYTLGGLTPDAWAGLKEDGINDAAGLATHLECEANDLVNLATQAGVEALALQADAKAIRDQKIQEHLDAIARIEAGEDDLVTLDPVALEGDGGESVLTRVMLEHAAGDD